MKKPTLMLLAYTAGSEYGSRRKQMRVKHTMAAQLVKYSPAISRVSFLGSVSAPQPDSTPPMAHARAPAQGGVNKNNFSCGKADIMQSAAGATDRHL